VFFFYLFFAPRGLPGNWAIAAANLFSPLIWSKLRSKLRLVCTCLGLRRQGGEHVGVWEVLIGAVDYVLVGQTLVHLHPAALAFALRTNKASQRPRWVNRKSKLNFDSMRDFPHPLGISLLCRIQVVQKVQPSSSPKWVAKRVFVQVCIYIHYAKFNEWIKI